MATNINTTTRESRRRKILERGSDRLALISGRSRSIPSQSQDIPVTDSFQPLNSHLHRQDLTPQFTNNPLPNCDDGEDSYKLRTNDSVSVVDAGSRLNNIEPTLFTPETITPSRTPASDVDKSLASSTDQRSSTQAAGGMQLLEQLCSNRLVTPSQISSAIAATESPRLFCSVIVAVFVVLSCLGFPLLGRNTIKSIICFRPLYLVLLTNLTLVLAQLIFNNQRGFTRIVGENSDIPSAKYDWAEQAGNALEIGLLMKKALDALVMDCSIYSIIVVAGFCILH
ncbi:uncharacterized protein [Euphorbia lathyris]|uniref:uncharacterized protein n=1 Tax=Euphorbia lathyris TaxID=212925 RepID=UPI0033143024